MAYLRRYERLRRKRYRRRHRVQWHLPGTVWAIDGMWLEQCVEGGGRRALIVTGSHNALVGLQCEPHRDRTGHHREQTGHHTTVTTVGRVRAGARRTPEAVPDAGP